MDIARTPAGLFRQMRAQGRPLEELELVRRAYDVGAPLHSARFEVDGTPFHTHGVGVASVIASIDAPAAAIGAAILHNVYRTGDWADARGPGPQPNRRKRIAAEVGPDVERLLTGLYNARLRRHLETAIDGGAPLVDDERWLVALELADILDKYDDGRVRYSIGGRSDRELVEGREDAVVELGGRVGGAAFADALRCAFDRAENEEIPPTLMIGRRYSEIVRPPSFAPRRSLQLLGVLRMVARRTRTLLRRVVRGPSSTR